MFKKLIFICCLIVTSQIYASVAIKGNFLVEQQCPAYQSIKKKTNPGHVYVTVGQTYTAIELNTKRNPKWVRVVVPEVVPQYRWVSLSNGKLDVNAVNIEPIDNNATCRTAGLADSYVLAISWQPAFCELHQSKRECQQMEEEYGYRPLQGPRFTLHGLWPNLKTCGTQYGYCDGQQKENNWSSYPSLNLSPAVWYKLAAVMPSVNAGSFLQRHEWYKHGTCQTTWDKNKYFDIAIALVHDFKNGVGDFIDQNMGKKINKKEFIKLLKTKFGNKFADNVKFKCSRNMLTEIQIILPADIQSGEVLSSLVKRTPLFSIDNQYCGRSRTLIIDEWGN